MNQKLKTSLAYIKNIWTTGALSETSRAVELEICKYISKNDSKVIVEFGMGHGNITREILNTISPTSKLYSFEVNKSFCDYVRNSIDDERLIIINDGAENIKNHINENVDAIIASIPFSFFSKEKGLGIIQDAYDLLNNKRYYSQVLYTKFNFKKFEQIFEECYIETIKKNTPKAYVFHCKKVKRK